jgi:ketosteroid isomerase-like protein
VKAKLVIATSVAVAVVAMAWMVVGSVSASADSDKAEIVALNQRQLDAFNKKDLDAVMAFYVDDKDAVFYEDTIPFQIVGASALRKYDQEFFESASQIHWPSIEAISVVVSGDLAAAHYTLPLTWTDRSGTHSVRSRFTQVLKKVNGKWLIWHEHLSVPYDPATGKAVLEAKP